MCGLAFFRRRHPHHVLTTLFLLSQVTKKMNKRQLAKRSKIGTFVKTVNYNHIMPTRYDATTAATLPHAGPPRHLTATALFFRPTQQQLQLRCRI